MIRKFVRTNEGEKEKVSLPPEEKPFSLSILTRHPINPYEDFGLALNGVGASTDEWNDLGLEFETLDAAWLAACVLIKLLPPENTPWLIPDQSERFIEIYERRADGSNYLCPTNKHNLRKSVEFSVEVLLAAKDELDRALSPETDIDF